MRVWHLTSAKQPYAPLLIQVWNIFHNIRNLDKEQNKSSSELQQRLDQVKNKYRYRNLGLVYRAITDSIIEIQQH